jgi:hypothetical protein
MSAFSSMVNSVVSGATSGKRKKNAGQAMGGPIGTLLTLARAASTKRGISTVLTGEKKTALGE